MNERNHCITDMIVEKMLVDQPKLSLDVALCWANMAKNSLQMHNGFSSYQLVFGSNPKLPNVAYDKLPALEGVTTSESVQKHLLALHNSRREYVKSESCERIRRALRHKVRASEKSWKAGDKCYYKRHENRWRGPATVICNDGGTYILRDGGHVVMVTANRMGSLEDTAQFMLDNETNSEENSTDSCSASPSMREDGTTPQIEVIINDKDILRYFETWSLTDKITENYELYGNV